MKLNATAYGRKSDLRDACGRLDMKAGNDEDAAELAALYVVITQGGRLTIERAGQDRTVIEFPDLQGRWVAPAAFGKKGPEPDAPGPAAPPV